MTPQSIRPALRATDRALDPATTIRDMVSLIEQTVNDIARLTRGMTTATPERRRFREEVEDAFKRFIEGTASPAAARTYSMPDDTLTRIYGQSVVIAEIAASAPTRAEPQGEEPARPDDANPAAEGSANG